MHITPKARLKPCHKPRLNPNHRDMPSLSKVVNKRQAFHNSIPVPLSNDSLAIHQLHKVVIQCRSSSSSSLYHRRPRATVLRRHPLHTLKDMLLRHTWPHRNHNRIVGNSSQAARTLNSNLHTTPNSRATLLYLEGRRLQQPALGANKTPMPGIYSMVDPLATLKLVTSDYSMCVFFFHGNNLIIVLNLILKKCFFHNLELVTL